MIERTKWAEKVWGVVYHVFNSDQAAVSYLQLNPGFRCSKHKHNFRVNQFNVISGKVSIESWHYHNGSVSERREQFLGPGDSCVVESGIYHRFRVLEPSEMIEVYWPQKPGWTVSETDIVRLDEVGPDV